MYRQSVRDLTTDVRCPSLYTQLKLDRNLRGLRCSGPHGTGHEKICFLFPYSEPSVRALLQYQEWAPAGRPTNHDIIASVSDVRILTFLRRSLSDNSNYQHFGNQGRAKKKSRSAMRRKKQINIGEEDLALSTMYPQPKTYSHRTDKGSPRFIGLSGEASTAATAFHPSCGC